ncbi:MAG: bis(5'-nucleosyl)-tetraphosphatase (symmetrical) YqeK [Oscillospiraceae bacterium]
MEQEYLINLAKNTLSEKRFFHTLNVNKLALELAQKYGCNKESVYTAAILHDITKEMADVQALALIDKEKIEVSNVIKNNPSLYHGLTAFLFCRDTLNITDTDVLNAIKFHTTGRTNMSLLEKIIYAADSTSYERKYENCEHLREMAFEDIDGCMLEILKFTISKVTQENKPLDMQTVECYNDFVLLKFREGLNK